MSSRSIRRIQPKRSALVVALGLGFTVCGAAFGQATTGSIFGTAPQQSGETVLVRSSTGLTRTVAVTDGRFVVGDLPVGTYTVTLRRNGAVVSTRNNVMLTVGAGTNVDFTPAAVPANAQKLGAVEVSASVVPPIDVSSVNSQTVITSKQLAILPIANNATAIALLAPGAVKGSARFAANGGNSGYSNVVSFGGSSVTENAYYINGFNTTDPLSGFGGMTLPYGAIAQQQMLTGGYGAKYGRSDGGVISQVGKQGTNQWHFGGQVRWLPRSLQASPRNVYFPAMPVMYIYSAADKDWMTRYSAYAGGPLVKDTLFLFAAADFGKTEGKTTSSMSRSNVTRWRKENPNYYVKLDWNITNSNILEFTGARSSRSYSGKVYAFDYSTLTAGGFHSNDTTTDNVDKLWVLRYTGYITDNLTVSAMYGKLHHAYHSETPGTQSSAPYIMGPTIQNPAFNGGTPITNDNSILKFNDPDHTALNTNLRINVTWRLGNHTLTAGIDNQDIYDNNDGFVMSGPGYAWDYGRAPNGDATKWIVGGPGTDPNWQNKVWVKPPISNAPAGADGFYVAKHIDQSAASVSTTQRAQYIQDDWHINDRWLVRIGLRNDQFTNYNPAGEPYLRLTSPQWSPRLGFTWDVYGDSTFKVYGNAGRYYLAMPASVALREAGASLSTDTYYTYTSINPDGTPGGLEPIDTSRGLGEPVSPNNEYGQPRDPKTSAARNIQAEYQDEFILGFDKQLGHSWVYGVKATYRKLKSAIDDVGDMYAIANKMVAMGLVTQAQSQQLLADAVIPASILFNPGRTNVFRITNPSGGYYTVPMTMKDFGFNTSLKRSYWGLDFYLEHPFDGKWFGKITYTLSHSYGNTEGQVRSDIGDYQVSSTVDWDFAQLMDYANGDLGNDRRHQLKAYGMYQITPEWSVSGNVRIMSGMPRNCLGLYGPNHTNPGLGYGPMYHWCDGKPFPPGTQHNPWEYHLDLGVQYRPEWAGKRLRFNLNIQNALNRQSVRQTYAVYMGGVTPMWPALDEEPMGLAWTQPRRVALSISYDY